MQKQIVCLYFLLFLLGCSGAVHKDTTIATFHMKSGLKHYCNIDILHKNRNDMEGQLVGILTHLEIKDGIYYCNEWRNTSSQYAKSISNDEAIIIPIYIKDIEFIGYWQFKKENE
jgi:hypothetical protein